MKKLVSILLASALFLALTGCATVSHVNAIDTGVAVSSANFHYVKSVEGSATSTYILDLFGSDAAGKAIDLLRAQAALKDNQALVNVAVVDKVSIEWCGIIIRHTTTVTADVIEFTK